jgi:hypothetical protein
LEIILFLTKLRAVLISLNLLHFTIALIFIIFLSYELDRVFVSKCVGLTTNQFRWAQRSGRTWQANMAPLNFKQEFLFLNFFHFFQRCPIEFGTLLHQDGEQVQVVMAEVQFSGTLLSR